MSRRGMWTRLLIALVAGCVVLTGCSFNGAYDLPLPGKVVSDSDGYKVSAEFDDIVSVVPRTLVMANDVPVGQVDSIGRSKDGWHAVVVMTIKKSVVLPANATAAVQQTSLLGEKYIAFTAPPGSSVAKDGRLSNGAYLKLNSTTRDPEVEDVLGALSALLSGGGVAQLHTISVELNKAFDGRQADVRAALHQLDTFVNSLDHQKSDIVAAMSSINTLTATLNRERNTIG
ncbi:MAG: MCE family protein, partial [Marmoricola sp.]